MNPQSLAIILVRFVGFVFLLLAVQGLAGLVVAHTLIQWWWSFLPQALQDYFGYFYAAALWCTPFYFVFGVLLLIAAKRLASVVSRGC